MKFIKWITKKGRLSYKPWKPRFHTGGEGVRMLTCAEAARLPKADTSWMDRKPSTVESYYAWTGVDLPMTKVDPIPTFEQRVFQAPGPGSGYRTPESEGEGPEFPSVIVDEPPPGFVEDIDIPC